MLWKRAGVLIAAALCAQLCSAQGAAPAQRQKAGPPIPSAVGEKSPCGDWSAWHDHMPGKKPTLHVTGLCTFPTGGYKVTLKRAVPPGINPKILVLDLKIVKPTGEVTQQITKQKATFTEQTNQVFTDVQIRPDNVTVPVKITQ
jgi:hypothetical protein